LGRPKFVEIYGHALSTGSVDEAANTWIITIDERRHLRRRTTLHRQNDYQMGNFKPKQLGITRVCKLVRTETLERFWAQITFRSANTYVFAKGRRHLAGQIQPFSKGYRVSRMILCTLPLLIRPRNWPDFENHRPRQCGGAFGNHKWSCLSDKPFSVDDPAEPK